LLVAILNEKEERKKDITTSRASLVTGINHAYTLSVIELFVKKKLITKSELVGREKHLKLTKTGKQLAELVRQLLLLLGKDDI